MTAANFLPSCLRPVRKLCSKKERKIKLCFAKNASLNRVRRIQEGKSRESLLCFVDQRRSVGERDRELKLVLRWRRLAVRCSRAYSVATAGFAFDFVGG